MKNYLITFIIFLFLIYPTFSKINTPNYNKKYVALTFDDGPSNYTDDIVNLLYKNNSTATFFIVGNKALHYQKTLNNIISKGNEIANHTYSHPWLTHLTNEEILNEINETQEIVNLLTGKMPTLFRPSYGSLNKKIKELITLDIIMWTNDSNDWKYKTSKAIASNVIRNIKEDDIILMHDTYKKTLQALKIIIPKLKELNYEIVSVSKLMEIKELRELSKF